MILTLKDLKRKNKKLYDYINNHYKNNENAVVVLADNWSEYINDVLDFGYDFISEVYGLNGQQQRLLDFIDFVQLFYEFYLDGLVLFFSPNENYYLELKNKKYYLLLVN